MADNFDVWTQFYSEFADALLAYKNDRPALIKLIQDTYAAENMKLAKLEDGEVIDIDPFTVYGLFNKGISWQSRIQVITAFKKAFDIKAPVPDRFEGLPVLNNMHATFYWFKNDRRDIDIPNLWDIFEAAFNYANNQSRENRQEFIAAFDAARENQGVKWNLTMGLYWMRPNFYLSLDSRNRWYVLEKGGLDEGCKDIIRAMNGTLSDGTTYLTLLDKAKACLESGAYSYRNIPEFSYEAWKVSEKVNQENKEAEKAAAQNPGSATLGDANQDDVNYWLISPWAEASRWDEFYSEGIIALGWEAIGNIEQYETREEISEALKNAYDSDGNQKNNSLALWQFCHELKQGDVVYAKRGRHEIIGRGVIVGDYEFDQARKNSYKNIRRINWTHKGTWVYPGTSSVKSLPVKALTNMTAYTEIVENLEALFADEEGAAPEVAERQYPAYTKENFLADVYISEPEYNRLSSLLQNKKNIILQGAPGVGKTFMAKRLAYSIMGVKNPERVKLVQFHQSYSYEDFIMGYRPTENGFELRTGAFYDFCKRAEEDPDNSYFFIIDEINRGNLSKIFGELFMLIEPDKRGASLQLLYANEQFSVPANLYLIGMMNTADRSLALLDYALRRRFAFYEVVPAFQSDGFRNYRESLKSEKLDRLVTTVEQLNQAIENDDTLGRGFRIGHSYFCNMTEATDERLQQIVDFELAPMLEEYWFDEPAKVSQWAGNLKSALR